MYITILDLDHTGGIETLFPIMVTRTKMKISFHFLALTRARHLRFSLSTLGHIHITYK